MSDTDKIIEQIQADILNPQAGIYSILLKAKVLAHYLKNNDFKIWVKNEVDGYYQNNLPDYRIIRPVIMGTFFNGFYKYSNVIVPMADIDCRLQEFAEKLHITESIVSLEEMAKNDLFRSPLPGEWIALYNIQNTQSIIYNDYQLIEAHRPILGAVITQIIGTARSRLQDFILEISSYWDMNQEMPPVDRVDKIFQFTIINNHAGKVSMSDFGKDGDIYNVGQAGAVGKYARSDGNTFLQSEPRQTLTEIASEIQKLLEYFEQINPSATRSEMISYVNDETAPSFKRRASAALKACGESIFDEFVLENKYLKVIKETVKGWLQSAS